MAKYWTDGTSLYHYGIPGQKWGVQNGPPYPLGPKRLSSRQTVSSLFMDIHQALTHLNQSFWV